MALKLFEVTSEMMKKAPSVYGIVVLSDVIRIRIHKLEGNPQMIDQISHIGAERMLKHFDETGKMDSLSELCLLGTTMGKELFFPYATQIFKRLEELGNFFFEFLDIFLNFWVFFLVLKEDRVGEFGGLAEYSLSLLCTDGCDFGYRCIYLYFFFEI